MNKRNEEKHNLKENIKLRTVMTILGAIILIVGIFLLISATASFFQGDPSNFHLAFIGMPLIFVGIVILGSFNSGRLLRFQAKQQAPVKKDVTKYMLDETGDDIAKVIQKSRATDVGKRTCLSCGYINPSTNKFCGDCGNKMVTNNKE